MEALRFFLICFKFTAGRLRQQRWLLAGLVLLCRLLPLGAGRAAHYLLSQGVGFSPVTLAVTAPEGDEVPRLLERYMGEMEDIAQYCNIISMDQAAALEALRAADPGETLLEVNTGAMSRGYRSVPYPDFFLLRAWRDMGGNIILTADAHSAGSIVYGYTQAAELARAAGFARSALLTRKGWEERPLDF